MPRWKALPEELEPQVREFAVQLRTLVDRSGLSVAGVAERTGYSRTSWDRYLNGRLLAPQGAVTALAEVTGTNPVHLLTLWELAERAWSRAEMRRDPTMEALRVEEARAALREQPGRGTPGRPGPAGRVVGAAGSPGPVGPSSAAGAPGPAGPAGPTAPVAGAGIAGGGGAAGPTGPAGAGGSAGPAGPAGSHGAAGPTGSTGPAGSTRPDRFTKSAGPAGAFGASGAPAPAGHTPPPGAAASARATGPTASTRATAPPAPAGGTTPPGPAPGRGGRMVVMFLAGALGALLVVAAAVLLTDLGNGRKGGAAGASGTPSASAGTVPAAPSAGTPSPGASTPRLPPGVGCFGAECAGRDPETMGCGSPYATTAASRTVGTARVEVRYSEACGAAWARVTGAAPGDTVAVVVPGAPGTTHERVVRAGTDHTYYTLMLQSPDVTKVQACATFQTGPRACTPLN